MQSFYFNSTLSNVKRNEMLWNCDGQSVEPVTLIKYVAENVQMWKPMVKVLSEFQGHGIKIDRVNLILVTGSMIFFNILCAIAPCVTSSWAIVFFALILRLLPLVYILWMHHANFSVHAESLLTVFTSSLQ